MAAIRKFEPPRILASVLVAPDVWERLLELVPAGGGASLCAVGVRIPVHRCDYLPPGAIVPLDQHGRPLAKPSTSAGARS